MSETVEVTSAVNALNLLRAHRPAIGEWRPRIGATLAPTVPAVTAALLFCSETIEVETNETSPRRPAALVLEGTTKVEANEPISPRPAAGVLEDVPLLATRHLWEILRSSTATLELKIVALREMADRRDPKLSYFVASSLNMPRANMTWRTLLVHIGERIDHTDKPTREQLVSGLLLSARLFRDASTPCAPALWSAVRTLGALIEPEQTSCLLEFLRPSDALSTSQVALQALQNILAQQQEIDRVPEIVRERLTAFARASLEQRYLAHAEGLSLAANACAAARLAGVSAMAEIDTWVARLKRPALERQIKLILERTQNQGRLHR